MAAEAATASGDMLSLATPMGGEYVPLSEGRIESEKRSSEACCSLGVAMELEMLGPPMPPFAATRSKKES